MDTDNAAKIFDSLSSGTRLDIWRNLIKVGQDGKVAGDLAKELGIAPNSLSFHLKAMLHANLVSVQQEGRFQRYRANLNLMVELVAYLTEECCAGQNNIDSPNQCTNVNKVNICS
ncbi:ArsR/SmtB family transcription factor [Vibrio sp. MA40-2]|uniref:ArsR/SmtB family transcription factor n=1 Tax=Vibrio sp. MA40-2 TaxID=3391828 RepID=UPI0039A4EEE3